MPSPRTKTTDAVVTLPQCPCPSITPASGSYAYTQTVTLAHENADAALFYTLDGSTPTAQSLRYEGPLTVACSQTVNAIAVLGDMADSPMASAVYTINQ